MGNLFTFMPLTFVMMLIGTLALTGFPMLSGFYSKDLLLETAYNSSVLGIFVFFFACLAAFLTSFYSIRSLYFVFFGKNFASTKFILRHCEDVPLLMAIPMVILTICAIFSGYFLNDIFTGATGLLFMRGSIAVSVNASLLDHEFEALFIKLLPTIAGLLGTIVSLIFFSSSYFYKTYLNGYILLNVAMQKFYFDQLYVLIFARFSVIFGYIQYKLLDRGILELMGPQGLTTLLKYLMSQFETIQTGYLLHYLLIILTFMSILVVFSFFSFLPLDVLAICFTLIFLKKF